MTVDAEEASAVDGVDSDSEMAVDAVAWAAFQRRSAAQLHTVNIGTEDETPPVPRTPPGTPPPDPVDHATSWARNDDHVPAETFSAAVTLDADAPTVNPPTPADTAPVLALAAFAAVVLQ